MSCSVALVRTDILEERITSIIRVSRISELGTTLAVTSNRSTLQRKPQILQTKNEVERNVISCFQFWCNQVIVVIRGFYILVYFRTSKLAFLNNLLAITFPKLWYDLQNILLYLSLNHSVMKRSAYENI
jgi:hypothetical protein